MTVIANINPEILLWARESSGYSIEDVVTMMKQKTVTSGKVEAWEQGEAQPTYPQFKKLANFYKRPTALFFFPEPPNEESIDEDFRTLPVDIARNIPPDIRYCVRKAKARQLDLKELHGDNVANAEIVDLKIKAGEKAIELAERIRNHIDISVEEQLKWKDADEALKNWRSALQDLDIWIFKDSFKNDIYSGFCIYDEKFPIIYVNSNKSEKYSEVPQRQIFTLFHELGHILVGKAGIDFREKPRLTGRYQEEEVFCNAFAGFFLVPNNSLDEYKSLPNDGTIKKIAEKYKVSFEVILRKFLIRKFISSNEYALKIEERKKHFKAEMEQKLLKGGEKKGGPSYFVIQKSYLGQKYLELAFKQYYKQRISEAQLADYLGVKLKSLAGLEEQL